MTVRRIKATNGGEEEGKHKTDDAFLPTHSEKGTDEEGERGTYERKKY